MELVMKTEGVSLKVFNSGGRKARKRQVFKAERTQRVGIIK